MFLYEDKAVLTEVPQNLQKNTCAKVSFYQSLITTKLFG